MSSEEDTQEKLTYLNVVIIVLSVYVLCALLVDTLMKLPPEVSRILDIIDNCICGIFLVEFFVRLYRAENKLKFMRWGWIDLVASIPSLDSLRYGRALRLFRLLRILRAFQGTRHIIRHLIRKRVQGTFTAAALIAGLLIIFSSIAILQVEKDPESNIKTAEDALWWAFSTITTVGYGDRYPVTTEGRIIAVVLMTVGVGLFGTFAAFVTTWFMGEQKAEQKEE